MVEIDESSPSKSSKSGEELSAYFDNCNNVMNIALPVIKKGEL